VIRIVAAGLFAVLGGAWLRAQPPPKLSEYQVKAAYLYNFGRFVAWPAASTSGAFTICVLGQSPFGDALEKVGAAGAIDGKAVVAKRLEHPEDTDDCRIVFISASEEGHLNQILTALGKTTVLTVSDLPQFTLRGGMIQFVADGTRVRFEVNLTAAASAGLTLSSELLKVAVAVRNTRRAGA
jgi:hypothetical protein